MYVYIHILVSTFWTTVVICPEQGVMLCTSKECSYVKLAFQLKKAAAARTYEWTDL